MISLGQRIKNRRIELGLTQEELGKMVGYKSRTTVNKVELGISSLNESKILAFAKALNTTPAYIMGWNEPTTKEENELISLINQLNEEEIKELSNFVDYIISKRQ
jgi:transcriptional regulator with XRE-family HTH domain